MTPYFTSGHQSSSYRCHKDSNPTLFLLFSFIC